MCSYRIRLKFWKIKKCQNGGRFKQCFNLSRMISIYNTSNWIIKLQISILHVAVTNAHLCDGKITTLLSKNIILSLDLPRKLNIRIVRRPRHRYKRDDRIYVQIWCPWRLRSGHQIFISALSYNKKKRLMNNHAVDLRKRHQTLELKRDNFLGSCDNALLSVSRHFRLFSLAHVITFVKFSFLN